MPNLDELFQIAAENTTTAIVESISPDWDEEDFDTVTMEIKETLESVTKDLQQHLKVATGQVLDLKEAGNKYIDQCKDMTQKSIEIYNLKEQVNNLKADIWKIASFAGAPDPVQALANVVGVAKRILQEN